MPSAGHHPAPLLTHAPSTSADTLTSLFSLLGILWETKDVVSQAQPADFIMNKPHRTLPSPVAPGLVPGTMQGTQRSKVYEGCLGTVSRTSQDHRVQQK